MTEAEITTMAWCIGITATVSVLALAVDLWVVSKVIKRIKTLEARILTEKSTDLPSIQE